MKLKRDEFKAMLKECILELVQEGKIFQGAPVTKGSQSREETSGSDGSPVNNQLNEAIRITTHSIAPNDPKKAAMYQSIIADTARTTLQKQLAVDLGGGGLLENTAQPEEREFDKAQLGMFAANNRWAQVAFGKKTKNNNDQ
jgi:hypothetical protein